MRIVLIHGVATDSRSWQRTAESLRAATGAEVEVPDRPQSGELETEIAFLQPLCEGAFVIGVSGGATLGLEFVSRGVGLSGAILHEPAAGSLAPGLLSHVGEGLRTDGVSGFGRALYGDVWTASDTRASLETVTREFAMFGAFEPSPLAEPAPRVVLTVGEKSPAPRYRAVESLAAYLGVPWRVLSGVGHAAHLEGGFERVAELPELFARPARHQSPAQTQKKDA